jgi:eukaryotic-like serine/threonine-protein kinase
VIWIVEQVCRALHEAHALGLVHRDIKPSNVLLCERGGEGDVAKLLDFGLVMDVKEQSANASGATALEGTPLYMAPESIETPGQVGPTSDLYSLGAVAFFLLTGETPFTGSTIVEVCMAHVMAPPRAPSELSPALSPELDAVVLCCLAKKPEARFQSALSLRDALLACPEAKGWSAASAAAWWQAHRAGFTTEQPPRRRHAKTEVSPTAVTEGAIRIDLEARARGEREST